MARRQQPEINGLRVNVTLWQEEDGTRISHCPVFHGQRMPELWRAEGAVENVPEEFAYMFRRWVPVGQGPTAQAALQDMVDASLKGNNMHGTVRVVRVLRKDRLTKNSMSD